MAGQYTDWEIAQEIARVLRQNQAAGYRNPQVRKYIAGMSGNRLTEQLKVGVWVKPLGSQSVRTMSCVEDVNHKTLVVIAEAYSTGDSEQTPTGDNYRQLIRRLFHNRRGTALVCEMYSTVRETNYDIDEALQRKLDVQLFVIESRFREDR